MTALIISRLTVSPTFIPVGRGQEHRGVYTHLGNRGEELVVLVVSL